MTPEQRVRITYQAFNERDAATALANLAADVRWDDGTGNMLSGKQAVAEHWREQWRQADAKIQIESLQWNGLALVLLVNLQLRQPTGTIDSRPIRNTLRFSGELIAAMQIG